MMNSISSGYCSRLISTDSPSSPCVCVCVCVCVSVRKRLRGVAYYIATAQGYSLYILYFIYI